MMSSLRDFVKTKRKIEHACVELLSYQTPLSVTELYNIVTHDSNATLSQLPTRQSVRFFGNGKQGNIVK